MDALADTAFSVITIDLDGDGDATHAPPDSREATPGATATPSGLPLKVACSGDSAPPRQPAQGCPWPLTSPQSTALDLGLQPGPGPCVVAGGHIVFRRGPRPVGEFQPT